MSWYAFALVRPRFSLARLAAGLLLAFAALAAGPAKADAAPGSLSRAAIEDLNWAEGLAADVRSEVGRGRLSEALPLCLKALELREKRLGKNADEVAESLGDLGVIYTGLNNFDAAERSLTRGLAIREKNLGKDHPYVGRLANNLALLWIKKGELARAEPLYQRALAIAEKESGPTHSSVGAALHNLGLLYMRMGEFTRAEPILLRALEIRKITSMPRSGAIASSYNALGGLYRNLGDYPKARKLFERAIGILNMQEGFEPPELASALNNLAELRVRLGDSEGAKPAFERALAIRERLLGSEHADVARALDNLAALHLRRGDLGAAEPMITRSLAILEKTLGPDHAELGVTLHHQAELLRLKGDVDRAMAVEERALSIMSRTLGEKHPRYAIGLTSMAAMRRAKGELDEASALLRRAYAINEAALGPSNGEVAPLLDAMARLDLDAGRPASALDRLRRAVASSDERATLTLATGSEHQKLAYMSTLRSQTDLVIALHMLFAPTTPEAAELALSTVLRRKGRVLDAMADSLLTLRSAPKEEDKDLLVQLTVAQREFSELALRGPRSMTRDAYEAELSRLDARRRRLEAKVSEKSDARGAKRPLISIAEVRAAIPEGAALVEIVLYSPAAALISRSKGAPEPDRYAAYVLRRSGPIGFVDLGEAAAIDALVGELRPALADRQRDPKPAARRLDQAVFVPLRSILGDTRWILISPDGSLNLVPFGALVGEDGRYRIEERSFTYLTSGRDLVRIAAAKPEPRSGAVVLGDPDFGVRGQRSSGAAATKPGAASAAERRDVAPVTGPPGTFTINDDDDPSNARDSDATKPDTVDRTDAPVLPVDVSWIRFPQLADTADEVTSIGRELKGSTLLVGDRATEEALKALRGPAIVHLATHGFFLADASAAARAGDATRGLILEDASPLGAYATQNPLLRSGVALARANERAGGAEDGVLTALEAAGLDLVGTKLVVLSACETGVGEARVGEGVYGLRRALVLAGSEAQVMSLWRVSDSATRDLMVAYYKRLAAGGGRSEALRQVEREMLATPERAHPYYWASFIVSGDGASLDGAPAPPSDKPIDPPKVAPGPRGCACEAAGVASTQSGLGQALATVAAGLIAASLRRRPAGAARRARG